jgi:hypothetical protein
MAYRDFDAAMLNAYSRQIDASTLQISRLDEVDMALLEFFGTIGFVAVVLLSLMTVLDVFFPRLIPNSNALRVFNHVRSRKLANVRAR